jgi:hypothetical protein
LVARLQHIVKGNSIVASRQDGELLAEDPSDSQIVGTWIIASSTQPSPYL